LKSGTGGKNPAKHGKTNKGKKRQTDKLNQQRQQQQQKTETKANKHTKKETTKKIPLRGFSLPVTPLRVLLTTNKNNYSTSIKNNFIQQQQSSRTSKISSFNKIPLPSP